MTDGSSITTPAAGMATPPDGGPVSGAEWKTYDTTAATYKDVRPTYPDDVYDAIDRYTRGLGRRALEIGIGTGQATRALAERGWAVVGLEPGQQLARIASDGLAGYPAVSVEQATFEDADLEAAAFDLVAAATAWHWVDPGVGYAKAAHVLVVDGGIGLWWNAHVPDTADERWTPIRAVYERCAPTLARLAPLTPDRHDYDPRHELIECGLFADIEQHVVEFERSYTTDEFLALIGTYASHQHLTSADRDRLHDGLRSAIDGDLGGVVTKPYEALLLLGRKR